MTATLSKPIPAGTTGTQLLRVREASLIADDVMHIVLESYDDQPLTPFAPGSHLVIDCGGVHNAYSLVNDGNLPTSYQVSVRRARNGNGGSDYLHQVRPGDIVSARSPRGTFIPVLSAQKQLLVAGGIGITPILAHLRAAEAWGTPAEVVYSFRWGSGAHAEEVIALCARAGYRLHLLHTRADLEPLLRGLLTTQPVGTHVYTCGPVGMIDLVSQLAGQVGWPHQRVHSEAFACGDLKPGEAFEVRLARSGRSVAVASGVSMLQALEQAGLSTPSLCRTGVCGECRLTVSAGTPLHRDLVLTEQERQGAKAIMPCVSRCVGEFVEVDL